MSTTSKSPLGKSNSNTQRNLFHGTKHVQLKSPIAKRPSNSQVTLQGWLHKQGSDGLQLWRKRWFVLSDLCLYYYKTNDEEKQLGSVLLPSYVVSECHPEPRKFAFKLEHANMRTYLLAADSHKSMLQWICALNLACKLQIPPKPQPLYENAPPKPRRVDSSQKYSHIIYANEQHVERRTPDTYGRSYPIKQHSADYEDIYGRDFHPKLEPQKQELIARPHSVDFLERHEERGYQPERPKSSLEKRIQPSENDFYSEQDYANKMRQSAMYLQYRTTPLSRTTYFDQHQQQYLTQRPIRSRSKSPQVRPSIETDKRREESMKRLIEWKQRMLQSPLNHKQMTRRKYSQGDYFHGNHHQPLNSHNSNSSSNSCIAPTHQYHRSTERLNPPPATSYSSDDEEEGGSIDTIQTTSVIQEVTAQTIDPVPDKNDSTVNEQHYMIMVPKKSILAPSGAVLFDSGSEESSYVEMMRGLSGNSILNDSQYETVCYDQKKREPVYMELGQNHILPDILINSETQKSDDSSDADDEASKDLNTLDTKPRISLSDTFRPASYYLGVNRVPPEFQDSSDSELVSPPPIPDEFVQFRSNSNQHVRSFSAIESTNTQQTFKNKRRPLSEDFCLDQSESIYTAMSGPSSSSSPPPVPLVPPPELTPPPPPVLCTDHDYENICIVKQKSDDKQSDDTISDKSSISDNNTIIISKDYYMLLRNNSNQNNNNNNTHNVSELNKLDKQTRKADMFQIALAATNSSESLDIRKIGKINNKNIYIDQDPTPKRSNSVEGLLNNVIKPTDLNQSLPETQSNLWKETLKRRHRHARSLDDLQIVSTPANRSTKLSRDVTYVNDAPTKSKNDKSFIIDREKLRQWDLMSSAPVLTANGKLQTPFTNKTESDKHTFNKTSASGSVSIVSGHDGQSLNFSQWSLDDRIPPNTSPNVSSLPRPNELRKQRELPDLKLSAGELLGRTHEELVLLLIQLRRQSITTYQAIESCQNQIEFLKSTLAQNDDNQKLQRMEQLKLQLLDLGKQYEKNKPLLNLVDNMVKLGSLYQKNGTNRNRIDHLNARERLQFNCNVQERRLLAEERKHFHNFNLNHQQLQSKIQQLYELDTALRHESATLSNLRKEKEYLENALGSLQSRLSTPVTPPGELDRIRRHQQLLERELSRVHVLLAYNSKKLEETVAGNARIEQELLVLRQKLQINQHQRNQFYFSNTIPKERKSTLESAPSESELKRVQMLMGDLQKQRQQLSLQVRNLTDKSQNLAQQIQWPSTLTLSSPKSWIQTDLDISPIATDESQYLNVSNDKQEIKTVRIVKRESERRHRERHTDLQNKFKDDLQTKSQELNRRIIPKEKRRHHTAPDNNHITRELSLLTTTSTASTDDRSLDDLDMERALRPRINTPDVVRSTLGHKEVKYNENTIDNLLDTPRKIIIPERYMPQDLPQLSAEEQRLRMRKVESIKKMLSDSTTLTPADTETMSDEKRQRQHLLQLNEILARQVIEMSKIVAGSKKPESQ